jgi:aminopeptidase N
MYGRLVFSFCLLFSYSLFGQSRQLYDPLIDVQHYQFHIQVSDDNDSIKGNAFITTKFLSQAVSVSFDLININDTGRGMYVAAVKMNGANLSFSHKHNILQIQLGKTIVIGEEQTFEISYTGIPADGLIIRKNKYGHRTMFADNWPNRARNWIPCKDHLSDKAGVDFFVTAPDHYQVISNGVKQEETNLVNHLRLTHWKEDVLLPTKVMVIGLADFAVDYPAEVNGIQLSSWVFPEDRDKGFYDYAQAAEILPFFIQNVGPYAYKKLANVESKTIFGGMENASAIFYYENSITGKRTSEALLVHEIAHQWFGNSATESDWPHLWLSEGFATEMTNLYFEKKYGADTLIKRLKEDRKQVFEFAKKSTTPIVDTSARENPMIQLNANSYQKGGFVLHMLRRKLGDVMFWKSIQQYYTSFRGKNASTRDLQKIFEQASGQNLATFFDQWCYTAENPSLQINWVYAEKEKQLIISILQKTKQSFLLPLELEIVLPGGKNINHTVSITGKTTQIKIPVNNRPAAINPDPGCNLLFESVILEQ